MEIGLVQSAQALMSSGLYSSLSFTTPSPGDLGRVSHPSDSFWPS